MSSKTDNIQKMLNNADSLSEIGNIISCNKSEEYYISKDFENTLNFFSVELADTNNVQNSKILCYNSCTIKYLPINEVIKYILNLPKINLEMIDRLSLHYKDDTKQLLEDDKLYLAKKYASFIDFLFEIFPNASQIEILGSYDNDISDCFLFFILKHITSDKIRKIGTIYLDNIVNFSKRHDIFECDSFFGTKLLKEINMYIRKNEASKKTPLLNNILELFLNRISEIKNITLNIGFEINYDTLAIISKILEHSESINLNVSLDSPPDWTEYFLTPNYEFTNETIIIKNKLTTLYFCIENINHLNVLKELMLSSNNLERITIFVNQTFLRSIYKQYNNYDQVIDHLRKYFDYSSILKKLTIAKISIGKFYHEPDFKDIDGLRKLYDYFLESIVSILPNNITLLYLFEIDGIEKQFFDKISLQFPYLKTISFLSCGDIHEDVLMKFTNLQHVVFYEDRNINIPKWVETVMFCYFEVNHHKSDEHLRQSKNDKYYFKLMKNTFHISLRCFKSNQLHYIVFLKNFLEWKIVYYLLDELF